MKFCFLDMDGILVDFTGGACKVWNRANPYTSGLANGAYDLDKFLDIPPEEFWKPMDHAFWRDLSATSDSGAIIELVKRYFEPKNIAILSAPFNSVSASGKVEWLQQNLPEFSRRYILAPKKYFCASADTVLIDDFDRNVDEFNAAGGNAFLLPRPWNSRYSESDKALELLAEFLEITCKRGSV
jgi:5'(3')-deoxyribonucleotidase